MLRLEALEQRGYRNEVDDEVEEAEMGNGIRVEAITWCPGARR